MASPVTEIARRFFAAFEGTRDPYPVALFRVAFFGGVALHFFPSLIVLDDGYRRGALRSEEWNHWLYVHFTQIQPGTLRAMSLVTMVAIACGVVGLRPRMAAVVGGLGVYAFASFNGLHVHTLALLNTWAFFLLFALCSGGSGALSVDALLAKKTTREDALLPSLALFTTLLSVFFAGIEKLLVGWPFVDEMGVLLAYPKGFLVRDWVATRDWMHASPVTHFLTWATIVIELGAPIALYFKRARMIALVAYELFFLGIVGMLEVPPLFWFMFAFGALLALDDDDVARIRSRFTAKRAEASASPT